MFSSEESDYESKKTKKRQIEHNKKCPVKGCNSQSKNGIKFFNFPKDKKSKGRFSPLAKLWCFFTRVKGFQPISTQAMCELHFSDKCITVSKRDGKKTMKPKSVPTIYYNQKGEKVEVPYDQQNMIYVGEEVEQMKREMNQSTIEYHLEMVNLRSKRMEELKNFCRFCFTNRSDAKCLEMSKLQTYSIDPLSSLQIIGISMQYAEAFNEIICPYCFEKVIDFENYRKRCQNAQNELIKEIEELNNRVNETQIIETPPKLKIKSDHKSGNFEIENNFDSESEDDMEHFDNGNDFDNDQFFVTESTSQNDLSIVLNESKECNQDIYHVMIKSEPEFEYSFANEEKVEVDEDEIILQKRLKKRKIPNKTSDDDKHLNNQDQPSLNNVNTQKMPTIETSQNELQEPSVDTNVQSKITKTRGYKRKRLFECFFCRLKFAGLKVFTDHVCTVKRVKCEVQGCESYFINQGGYNQHIHHRHNLPKVSKKFCPVCQTCFQMNVIQFDEHCKKCVVVNEYREQQIQCKQCKKICDNLQSFTAHMMLHDTKNLKKPNELDESGNPIPVDKIKKPKERKMCDLCGKVFDTSGLQRHKLNVHFVNFTGEMYYCDLCPIAKPTKRLLYNHMKGTHIIKWTSCETCGKVFRNRDLWRKHQLIHGDFKKNNRCNVCPHRPGFVTKAALSKHMRSNHGGAQPIRKFNCDVCQASYSRDDLLIRHRANVHQIHQNNYTEEIISQYVKY